MSAEKPDISVDESWEEKLHKILLRPHLEQKNSGVSKAIEALSSPEMLNLLWEIPSEGHRIFAWWLAPSFIEALKKLPYHRALAAISDLAVIHQWMYEELAVKGRFEELEWKTPISLLEYVVPPEYGIGDITAVFNVRAESEPKGTPAALRALCRLMSMFPGPRRPLE